MISSVRSATKCNINRCVNYTFIWLYSTTNHIFVYVCVYVCVERTIITGLYVSEPKSPPDAESCFAQLSTMFDCKPKAIC